MTLVRWIHRSGWLLVWMVVSCSDDSTSPIEDAGQVDAAVVPVDAEGDAPDAAQTSDSALTDDAALSSARAKLVEHATITPRVDPCVASPSGVGAYGVIRAYDRYEIDNPAWTAANPRPVEVLVPSTVIKRKHPVIVYAHPYGGDDWTRVRTYLEFLVSRDHVVIFPPYPTLGEDICGRYDTLRAGVTLASGALGDVMDTTHAGFIGHSFGGGATPWLAHEAVTKDGWGSAGLFLYPNAPWFVYRMGAADWSAFPAATRLVLMLFHEDSTNDHRIGIDEIWTPFPRQKDPRMLQSSNHDPQCAMTADHAVPATDSDLPDSVRFNALDTWGTMRYASALSACTFTGDSSACAILDGSAADALAMGTFASDGSAVPPMLATNPPVPANPSSYYEFPITSESQYPCTK